MKVHLAGPSGGEETASGSDSELTETVADGGESGDLFIELKGTFLARRR
jgi:hypothetical protein